MSHSKLFEPLSLLHGPPMRNRFMLAPLTNQQSEVGGAASEFDQDWIAQLARGGYALIQTCATTVEAGGIAFARQLGIHSDAHLPGLRQMADAMREGGALSAVQLHHAGHRANPRLGGIPAPASSDTLPGIDALTTEEVERIRDSFIAAAQRAERAGFDGVAVHGAFGWILSEFMSPLLNDRTDRYGGSIENRARLLLETTRAVADAVGARKTGIRLSPVTPANDAHDSDPQPLFTYVVKQLATLDLAYIHIIEGATGGPREIEDRPFDYEALKAAYREAGGKAAWMVNNGYDRPLAEEAVKEGDDLVAFGKPFISNPDLVRRLRENAPLNPLDKATMYGGGAKGYTDYPALA